MICKTIEAMTALCECKLFDHHTLVENVECVAPFLVYPVSVCVCVYICVYMCVSEWMQSNHLNNSALLLYFIFLILIYLG